MNSKTNRSSSVNMRDSFPKAPKKATSAIFETPELLENIKKSNSKDRRDAYGNPIVRGGNYKISFRDEVSQLNIEEIFKSKNSNTYRNIKPVKDEQTKEVTFRRVASKDHKSIEESIDMPLSAFKYGNSKEKKPGTAPSNTSKRRAPKRIVIQEIDDIPIHSRSMNYFEKDATACQNCFIF